MNPTILAGSCNTDYFIPQWVAKETHFYDHVVHNFQVMIDDGAMIKCGGKCENVKLQIGDYQLKLHMFSIEWMDVR